MILKSKKSSNKLPFRVLNKILPFQYFSPRFDPLFDGNLNLNYLNFLFKCLKNGKNIKYKKLKRMIFISSPRGGSHLFSSLFHNIENCFCFDEAFTNLDYKAINGRSFMLRGMYGINSLQNKNIKDIENICYLIHSHKVLENQKYLEKINFEKDVIIYIFRNPLRTIISRFKTKKIKWKSLQSTELFLNEFLENLRNYKNLKNKNKYKVEAIMLENFISNLDDEFIKICDFIWDNGKVQHDKRVPNDQFFTKFILCNSKPIIKNKYLTSRITSEKISASGQFNPMLVPNKDRLSNFSINLDKETEIICKKILGEKLYNLFLKEDFEVKGMEMILSFV